MPEIHQGPAKSLPDYDPARAARIHELIETLRATDDPKEIGRLCDQLDLFIFHGTDAEKKEQHFFALAERFRNESDPQTANRLGDELGRTLFNG